MVPLDLKSRRAQRRAIIECFERPICCYFCGKEIVKLSGIEEDTLVIHSLDGDHENWNPSNKVPAHNNCHTKHHHPPGSENPVWKGGVEATLERTRDQRLKRSSAQRRHRIHGHEIPEVMKGLALLLTEYVKTEEDLEAATVAFMPFYRMLYHRTGRPNYPDPTTWNTIVEAIKWYHLLLGEEAGR